MILEGEDVVRRITMNDIVRGAFQSAHLGYEPPGGPAMLPAGG